MDRTPAGTPHNPKGAERFNEEQATYTVRGSDQPDLAAAHPAANELTLENATKNSPIEYHPGALRYYEEQGIPVATPVPASSAAIRSGRPASPRPR